MPKRDPTSVNPKTVTIQAECPCCYCGLRVGFQYEPEVGIVHALPFCDAFAKLDTFEQFINFARACRRKQQAS